MRGFLRDNLAQKGGMTCIKRAQLKTDIAQLKTMPELGRSVKTTQYIADNAV